MHSTHSPALLARAARIRLIGFDVDGTLTDGRLLFDDQGLEFKSFHAQDGMGLVLLRESGIVTAFVTARPSPLVELRGKSLGVHHIHTHERRKLARMQAIATEMGIGMDEVAFMGDDLPDLATLRAVGLSIAPADAHPWVLAEAGWITPRKGGRGAARDACDLLLAAHGKLDAILALGEHP
ncbi:MAG: HAD hydrolase family protein [Xanthomonadales bacterium]|nr:HAD hydrolase family protein [Xanthomonadales bacterium]